MIASCVIADLVGYSRVAPILEESLGAHAVHELNEQILGFILQALDRAGGTREDLRLKTGDGGMLLFAEVATALKFAAALHSLAEAHNQTVNQTAARRLFRVGIGTGDIHFDPNASHGPALAGMAIVRAARLEARANTGGTLIDQASWEGASPEDRARYPGPETIQGKHGESFKAYHTDVDDAGEMLEISAVESMPRRLINRKRADVIAAIREVFFKLRREQIDYLLIVCDVPPIRLPGPGANGEQILNDLLKWAAEDPSGLDELLDELRRL